MTKTSGWPGIERSGSTDDAAGAIEGRRRALARAARRRRRRPRGPSRALDALAAERDAGGVDVCHGRLRPHLDAERAERPGRAVRARPACRRRAGSAGPPRRGRRAPRADRSTGSRRRGRGARSRRSRRRARRPSGRRRRSRTSAGAAARRRRPRARRARTRAGCGGGSRGVLEGLQARRVRLPVVVAEVGVAGAGREDQVVVARPLRRAGGPRDAPESIADDVGEQDLGVRLAAQDRPDRDTRCRPARAPPSRPGRAAAGRGGGCGGRRR